MGMEYKYNGDKEEFVNRLNKVFQNNALGQQVGNVFRYVVYNADKKYNINLYSNGTVNIQPEGSEDLYNKVKNALSNNVEEFATNKNKTFIVHGHDINSKRGLENMLLKWGIEPYAIQDEDSKGKTIIEFLESQIVKHSVGIVLLTADDFGYSQKEGEENQKPRARQNVILELGMLIGSIGRERCIILRHSSVETPSDIAGLIYITFDKDIEEVKDKLKQKLKGLNVHFRK